MSIKTAIVEGIQLEWKATSKTNRFSKDSRFSIIHRYNILEEGHRVMFLRNIEDACNFGEGSMINSINNWKRRGIQKDIDPTTNVDEEQRPVEVKEPKQKRKVGRPVGSKNTNKSAKDKKQKDSFTITEIHTSKVTSQPAVDVINSRINELKKQIDTLKSARRLL